jgi:two-component system chemotaxis response regulator CheB
MIVDDSAVVRGLLARTLEADPSVKVVASVSNGEMAVSSVARHDIDVVILDIEMPVMDGLTALPKIIAAAPGVKVIMASTLTARNAEISLKCLTNGADDYVPKPSSTRDLNAAGDFQRELLQKVKALAAAKRGMVISGDAQPAPVAAKPVPSHTKVAGGGPITLHKPSNFTPAVLAIGSSTGGPQALFKVFKTLDSAIQVPIFITQHMPPTFTQILAEHISQVSGRAAAEGVDGEVVEAGRVYVAPGDYHMTVVVERDKKVIRLNQDSPENSPGWAPTARRAARLYPKAEGPSSARTRPPASSGACLARPPPPASAARFCRSTRLAAISRKSWRARSNEAGRLSVHGRVPQGAVGPRPLGRQGLPHREPASAGGAQAGDEQPG